MAGYSGWSMSNNAVAAYDNEEMPKSKWTKKAMLSRIADLIEEENTDLDIKLVSKLSKKQLQDIFLTYSGWHHTSKFYNKTIFFEVDLEDITNQKIQDKLDSKVYTFYFTSPKGFEMTYPVALKATLEEAKENIGKRICDVEGVGPYCFDQGIVKKVEVEK